MHDLIIKNGTVVDGTGGPRRNADLAIRDGLIAEVGQDVGAGRRTIDADGALVLPGWVDIHTHYDGQVTWDPCLTPSSWHGVTTAVFGNCGVGFAPVRQSSEDYLINLMEGVEDIPGTVLSEGIDFSWETFPEYLDVLDSKPKVMDVGAQIPHGALRFYVMGMDGADHAVPPDADQIERMGEIVEQGLRCGALGFSTSRTTKHKAADGRPTPSLSAGEAELAGIAQAMGRAGSGVIQVNSDMGPGEMDTLLDAARLSGRPLSVLLLQVNHATELWRETLGAIEAANQEGLTVTGQVGCRPIGILMGLDTSVNPFSTHAVWKELGQLDLEQKITRLQESPALQSRLVDETPDNEHTRWILNAFERTYELGESLDYEPSPECSIAARGRNTQASPWLIAMKILLAGRGDSMLLHTFENYAHGDLEDLREMLVSEHTICGLGDAGAHVATICDAAYPTFLVQHWGRDRNRGAQIDLEFLVAKQTSRTANAFGLQDRGVLAPGYRADINVVDLTRIGLDRPAMSYDLPAGGKRLVQRSFGYLHTLVAGVETHTDGEHTGELPGRLIRGPQRRPN